MKWKSCGKFAQLSHLVLIAPIFKIVLFLLYMYEDFKF